MSVLDLPTPLARLYGLAMEIGVSVASPDAGWPDDGILAIVGAALDPESEGAERVRNPGAVILTDPRLDDDLCTETLAFAVAILCTQYERVAAAPERFVAIGRERLPEPIMGVATMAREIAARCGYSPGERSLEFEIRTPPPVDGLSRSPH